MSSGGRGLRRGEALAAVSAIALLVLMFTTWYEDQARIGVDDATFTAWQAYRFTDLVLLLTAAAALALAATAVSRQSIALPVATGVLTAALGLVAVLLVIYRILNQPGENDLVEVRLGAILGLVAVAGIFSGGYLSMRDEGAEDPEAIRQAGEKVGPPRPAPPPDVQVEPPGASEQRD